MERTIKILYDIGDVVKYNYIKNVPHYVKCPFCGGIGEIKGLNEDWADCPICGGDKKIKSGYKIEQEVKEGTISGIQVCWFSNNEHSAMEPRYDLLREDYRISQSDIIEKVISDQDRLAYSD